PKPMSDIVKLHNIADEIRRRGDRFSAEIHRLDRVSASHDLAAHFGIETDSSIFHSIVVYCANDIPVQLEDRYVLPDFAPDYLRQNFLSQSTTDYLQSIARPTS